MMEFADADVEIANTKLNSTDYSVSDSITSNEENYGNNRLGEDNLMAKDLEHGELSPKDEYSSSNWEPQTVELFSNGSLPAVEELSPISPVSFESAISTENSLKPNDSNIEDKYQLQEYSPVDMNNSSSHNPNKKHISEDENTSKVTTPPAVTVSFTAVDSDVIHDINEPESKPEYSLDKTASSTFNSLHKETSDQMGDSDEEYFEEYHLPNTHENTFVRHLSFRRKVQSIPINAPDADHIEGLVRTGELVRHGSIRRRIIPQELIEEDEYFDENGELLDEGDEMNHNSSNFSEKIESDIIELERALSEDNLGSLGCEYPSETYINRTPMDAKKLKRTTSTPKTSSGTVECEIDLSDNSDFSLSSPDKVLEDGTLRKIQECLDFSAYKDILNLSGRLSDILSPKEVEEVLINSERYRKYLDSEVFEALSLSFQGQTQSLPYILNTNSNGHVSHSSNTSDPRSNSQSNSPQSIPVTDSGFSSPKITKRKTQRIPPSELRLVRRLSTPCDGIAAPGIFIESENNSNQSLRKIPAPELNLDSSPEAKLEDSDEESDREEDSRKKKICATNDVSKELDCQEINPNTTERLFHEDYTTDNINVHKIINDSNPELEITTPVKIDSEMEYFPPLPPPDLIPELTAAEELSEIRHWRNVVIGGAWRRIDMKVIAPFKKCVSHGGYMEESQSPIVVLSAALLPDKSRKDYHYVMDNLFMYVLSFVEQLLADDYILVYFSNVRQHWAGPGFHWMRKAYEMIDRRLRKNLKTLFVVHPSLWSKTVFTLCRPFISTKFYRKLHYVPNLIELADLVPLEQIEIPDAVKQADFEVMIREKKTKRNKR